MASEKITAETDVGMFLLLLTFACIVMTPILLGVVLWRVW